MKKLKISVLVLTALLFVSTSCDDFIDIQPFDQIPSEEAFRSEEDFELALNAVYDAMSSGSYWGSAFLVVPEMMSDNVVQGETNNGAYAAVHYWNHNSTTGEFAGMWAAPYRVIFNANVILGAIDGFEATERLNEIKAEVYAARAMAHFDLVRCFAKPYRQSNPTEDLGVPVVTSIDFVESVPRNTIAEVYAQIDQDLQASSAAFSTVSSRSNPANRERITEGVLHAIWSRVAFEKGDWAVVEEMSSKAINFSGYRMDNNLANIWEASTSSEIILQMFFVTQEGPPRVGWNYVGLVTADYVASQSLLNSYSTIDNRYDFYFSDEITLDGSPYTPPNPGPEAVIKHRTNPDLFDGMNHAKVFRLAEMYLNRAEANLRKSAPDIDAATADLNAVRIARGLNAETVATLDEIRLERRREMAFEGDWWFYQKANGSGFFRLGDDCQLSQPADCVLQWSDNEQLIVFPIPQSETQANNGMVQNPGY